MCDDCFGNKRALISNDLWKSWIENVPNINSTQFLTQCLIKQNQINNTKQQDNSRRKYRR